MESSDDDLHSVNISLQGEDIELDLVGEGEYISDEENQNSTVDIQENLDGQDLADDADQPFAGNINETLELGVRSGLIWSMVTIIYSIVMTIVFIVTLAVDWNKSCSRHMHTWTIAQIILQIIMIGIKISLYRLLKRPVPVTQLRTVSIIYFVNRLFNFIWLSWFIIGTILRFGKAPCSANVLLQTILIHFVIQWCLFGIIVLACCCTAAVVGILYCVNPRMLNPGHVSGASKSQIKKLKEVKFNPDETTIDEEDARCAICLSSYENREKIRYLPCKHHFHSECVDKWLLKNKSCPFCKQEIDKKDEEETKDEIELINV